MPGGWHGRHSWVRAEASAAELFKRGAHELVRAAASSASIVAPTAAAPSTATTRRRVVARLAAGAASCDAAAPNVSLPTPSTRAIAAPHLPKPKGGRRVVQQPALQLPPHPPPQPPPHPPPQRAQEPTKAPPRTRRILTGKAAAEGRADTSAVGSMRRVLPRPHRTSGPGFVRSRTGMGVRRSAAAEPPLKKRRQFLIDFAKRRAKEERVQQRIQAEAQSREEKKKILCSYFCRFGRCLRAGAECAYLHEPSKVAICQDFLHGVCTSGDACVLSHEATAQRVPVCRLYLMGCCPSGRECAFSHVNKGRGARLCVDFSRCGYCDAGDTCAGRHELNCAEWRSSGRCILGEQCKLMRRMRRPQVEGGEVGERAPSPTADADIGDEFIPLAG